MTKVYRKSYSNDYNCNFEIITRYLNIDTKTISLEFEIFIGNGYKTKKCFSRTDVYNLSDDIINSGIDVSDKTLYIKNVRQQEVDAPLKFLHSTFGFSNYDNKLIYKGQKGINIDSTYVGDFDIGQRGTFEGWMNIVKEYAMTSLPLQFMIVAGLSSVVIGYLGDQIDGSLLLHIYSDSSKGKTTGSALAISTAGNPCSTTVKRSLQIDWGDTFNYRIASLSNNFGIPIVIDEASKISTNDISSFIYSCCNGVSKGRLSSNGSSNEVYHWKTCCISNGEQSLLPLCNNNQGIRARLIEINFDYLTESAEQADKLKEGIYRNYGFANSILANCILNDPNNVTTIFKSEIRKLDNEIRISSHLKSRLIRRLAAIVTTAILSSNCLGLNFDVPGIRNILIDAVEKQNNDDPINIGDRLIEYLHEDLISHSERYSKKNSDNLNTVLPNNCYGVYKDKNNSSDNVGLEVCYLKSQFKNLLKLGNFENDRVCLNELAKLGYLVHDKDRLTCKRKLYGHSLAVYVVQFPKEFIDSKNSSSSIDKTLNNEPRNIDINQELGIDLDDISLDDED